MTSGEIAKRFDATVSSAVQVAGAQLDSGAKLEFANFTRNAAISIDRIEEEEQQEAEIERGIGAYKTLVAEAAAFAKQIRRFPVIDKDLLRGVLQRRGPNPPYY